MRAIACEVRRGPRRVELRRERGQARGVEVDARPEVVELPAEDDHARVDEFPALDARDDAEDRVVRTGHAPAHSSASSTNRAAPRAGARGTRRTRSRHASPSSHASGTAPTISSSSAARRPAARAARPPPRPSRRTGAARARRSARTAAAACAARLRRRGGSRARRRGRSARVAVPEQHVRVPRACGRRSSRTRRTRRCRPPAPASARARRADRTGASRGGSRAPRFSPALAVRRSWISGSGSARPITGSSSTSDELGHRRSRAPRDLARDDLRDEGLRPLAGAAELEDVEPVVVGLDDRGQRAALAQRRDVARRLDRAQHRASLSSGRDRDHPRPVRPRAPGGARADAR